MTFVYKSILAFGAALVLVSGVATADVDRTSCKIEGLKKGMPYDSARAAIVAAGFGPDQREYRDHQCVFPRISSSAKFLCDQYPETMNTYSTGQAQQSMTFIDERRNRLLVGTIGEIPTVTGWRYDCSGWDSIPLDWSVPASE